MDQFTNMDEEIKNEVLIDKEARLGSAMNASQIFDLSKSLDYVAVVCALTAIGVYVLAQLVFKLEDRVAILEVARVVSK